MNMLNQTELALVFNNIFEDGRENKRGLHDFNGHFWVELPNGEIIDDYDWDHELNDFKRFFSIKRRNSVLEYERCNNNATNKIVFEMLDRLLLRGGLTLEETYELFGTLWQPERLCCMFNAVANQYKLKEQGAKIVFGCVYMKSDNNIKKHYICGGENFQTFYDFKKEYNPAISLFY